MAKIEKNMFVSLAYNVYEVQGDKEELMYTFTEDRPDMFVFGQDAGMIEGFKNAIAGLTEGDEFRVTLQPEQAFGPSLQDLIMDFDKSMFNTPEGVFDSEVVKIGNTIEMMTADRQRVPGQVVDITDNKVVLDFNHPLAGQTIRFAGKVLVVREATEEELNPRRGCGGCGGCGGGSDTSSCGNCGGGCGGCK